MQWIVRSQTRTLGVSLLLTWDIEVQLIIFSGILNQPQNWILREPILLWVPMALALSSYTIMT